MYGPTNGKNIRVDLREMAHDDPHTQTSRSTTTRTFVNLEPWMSIREVNARNSRERLTVCERVYGEGSDRRSYCN